VKDRPKIPMMRSFGSRSNDFQEPPDSVLTDLVSVLFLNSISHGQVVVTPPERTRIFFKFLRMGSSRVKASVP
jgi:hypothetical protein